MAIVPPLFLRARKLNLGATELATSAMPIAAPALMCAASNLAKMADASGARIISTNKRAEADDVRQHDDDGAENVVDPCVQPAPKPRDSDLTGLVGIAFGRGRQHKAKQKSRPQQIRPPHQDAQQSGPEQRDKPAQNEPGQESGAKAATR